MKNMQMTKEKVSKVTFPDNPISYHDWVKMYRFGSAYIKPTKFFQGNELDTRKFGKKESIPKVSWQDLIKTPFEIILKSTLRVW